MTTIKRTALLPYRARQMFDLVNDVEAYPGYMDGCVGAEVLRRGPQLMEARLDLAKGGVSHSFSTRNRLQEPDSISLELLEGPFEFFEGRWDFQSLGDSACKVSLNLQFGVNNAVLGAAASHLFDKVSSNMVDAVEKRAKQLYG